MSVRRSSAGRAAPGQVSERRVRGRSSSPLVSIVAPVYCEEETIAEFVGRVSSVMRAIEKEYSYEIVLVNDGSTDRSLEIMVALCNVDRRLRVIDLSRNFGHQRAITAGIDAAAGEAVIVMDSDLQDPPEVIPRMLEVWERGFHNVYGVRTSRRGESWFKRSTARLFYRLINRLSDVPIPLDSGDFRLLDRALVNALSSLREGSRYMRGLIAWAGFRQTGLAYDRDARFSGETKYSVGRMLTLALDGITGFSEKPLMIAVQLGLLITGVAFLGLVYIIFGRVFYPDTVVAGWTSMSVIVLFVGGVQILVSGLLGLYVGRIHTEVKDRPLYVVMERYGFPAAGGTAGADSRRAGRKR